MPINGVCGKDTPIKQDHFKTIIKHHIDVCQLVFKKHQWACRDYRYIDVFGGPGFFEGMKGSPVIFQEVATAASLSYDADIIEKDPDNYRELRRYVRESSHYRVHLGDNSDVLPQLGARKNQFGLVYFDPPQDDHTVPLSFDLMRQCAARWKYIDLMLYISPALLKRTRMINGYQPIEEYLSKIDKKYWIIRSLIGKHQWTFLIGTNYPDWANWEKAGFYPIDSPKGRIVFDRANLTKEEFKKKVQPGLTGLMQNTCSIPHLELSERKQSSGPGAFAKGVIAGLLRKFTI